MVSTRRRAPTSSSWGSRAWGSAAWARSWGASCAASASALMAPCLVVAPLVVYPVFLMKALCFALFACAFNLLIGYVGLLSFGHALYFGWAGYVSAYGAKGWGVNTE